VARHIFQAFPVWIYTQNAQSNITHVLQKATLDEDEDDDSEDDDDDDDGCDAEDSNDDGDDEDDDDYVYDEDDESDEESGKKITPPVNLTSCRAFQFSTQYVTHSNHSSQIVKFFCGKFGRSGPRKFC
jgi:hypothetical protein